MSMSPPILFSLVLLLLCSTVSCRSTNHLLKAKAVPLSSFVQNKSQMKPQRERVPFHKVWSNPMAEIRQRAAAKREIYIAPVSLKYLRPIKKDLARKEVAAGGIHRREREMAALLQREFAAAFARSPAPRYIVTPKPTAQSVTLEMAIVELNPTSPKGNAVKTALKFVVGPLAGLGGYFTKGNIAIEGKIRNSQTGELVFEFADNEADVMTLYSARDFKPYGHAVHAIKNWAIQFELFTRTPPNSRIDETWFFTLSPL